MWPFTSRYPELAVSDVAGKTFDYVVVGGGTAGCVLASRLSEDAGVSVLLVEKGRVRDNLLSRIPLLSSNFFLPGLQVVSDRFSEPIAAAGGRRTRLWGAEAVGGSSRINIMLVTRGVPAGYDEWADMGFPEWSYDKVESYFVKMESAKAHAGKPYRGHGGPLENRQFPPSFELYSYVEKACGAVGLPVERDCNSPGASAQGYFDLDVAVDGRGSRVSAYRAYLGKSVALQRRRHLAVCTGAVAAKLLVDAVSRRVTGVRIRAMQCDGDVTVSARREVIVCNGAFRTPQLLLLSGIGPEKQLAAHGIPCVLDLPAVGENLSDHYSVPIMSQLPMHDSLHKLMRPLVGFWHLLLCLVFGTGIMSRPSNHASIFVRTTAIDEETMTVRQHDDGTSTMDARQPRNIPDVEIMINPVNSLVMDMADRPLLTWYTTLVQPLSRGRVELADRDPLAHPRVHYAMFTHERDRAAARTATRFAMKLAGTFAASGYPYPAPLVFAPGMVLAELEVATRLLALPLDTSPAAGQQAARKRRPELAGLKLRPAPPRAWRTVTDAEIDAYASRVALSSLHFSCTCRMSEDATGGVVDQRLRVHGISNLRIADASIFPKIPSAHTMAPVIMVAERCADFVKEDWARKKTE